MTGLLLALCLCAQTPLDAPAPAAEEAPPPVEAPSPEDAPAEPLPPQEPAPQPAPALRPDAPARLPEADRRIAVAAFATGPGVDAALAEAIADVLVIELEKIEGIEILSRGDLRAVLDHAAEMQLAGCAEPRCFLDVGGMLPARRLLAGTVRRADNGALWATASLIDLTEARVAARVEAPLGHDLETARAALKTVAVAMATGDARGLSADAVSKAELTAGLLEQVRIAERYRSLSVRALGGTLLSVAYAFGDPIDPPFPGIVGQVVVDVPVSPWLSVIAGAGGHYYTGRLVTTSSTLFVDDQQKLVSTNGAFVADFGIGGGRVLAGVELQPPTGLVRPYVDVAATVDLLVLDVSDLVYVPDEGQPDLPPAQATPIPFRQSIAPGAGVQVAVGTDWNVAEHVGLSLELSGYLKLHGLEKDFLLNGVEQRQPLAPLTGVQLTLGGVYEL